MSDGQRMRLMVGGHEVEPVQIEPHVIYRNGEKFTTAILRERLVRAAHEQGRDVQDVIEFEDGSVAIACAPFFDDSTLRRPIDCARLDDTPSMAEQWVRYEAALWGAAALAVQHRHVGPGGILMATDDTLLAIKLAYARLREEWAAR